MTGLSTIILLAIVTILMIVWTSIKASNSIIGDTISEIIAKGSSLSLLLPAMLGTLFGHWLWPAGSYDPPKYVTAGVLSMLGLLWLGLDLHYWIKQPSPTGLIGVLRKYPVITFVIHIVIGHFFFPL